LATVGIIANPASGKDIRRLVALGLTVDNNEKVNVVRRILTGLHASGVDQVVFMPDYFAIGRKALDGLHLDLPASILDMRVRGTQQDSTDAARIMAEMGCGCIVTLGGDGTNRAVSGSSNAYRAHQGRSCQPSPTIRSTDRSPSVHRRTGDREPSRP